MVFSVGDALTDPLMRAGGVVVLLILGQDSAQLCLAEDQHPVHELTAQRAGKALAGVLEETSLLTHLNPGVMSWQDLQRLKPAVPSMGMMPETTATRPFAGRGPHATS
jgi:2-iminoacetate synthase ThiH